MSIEERVENVEVKLAFMEKLISELDDVVRGMAMQVDVLREDLGSLRAQVLAESDQQASPTDQEPPPHY